MMQDRGSMKWTAMMLTDHVSLLKKWKEEQYNVPKRELVEWELEELQLTIQRAFQMKLLISFTLWDNNKLHVETGMITATDTYKKELLLETERAIKRISFGKIQDAKLVNSDD